MDCFEVLDKSSRAPECAEGRSCNRTLARPVLSRAPLTAPFALRGLRCSRSTAACLRVGQISQGALQPAHLHRFGVTVDALNRECCPSRPTIDGKSGRAARVSDGNQYRSRGTHIRGVRRAWRRAASTFRRSAPNRSKDPTWRRRRHHIASFATRSASRSVTTSIVGQCDN